MHKLKINDTAKIIQIEMKEPYIIYFNAINSPYNADFNIKRPSVLCEFLIGKISYNVALFSKYT